METREWRTVDKTEWGAGPWQDEPDKKQWRDEATGLPCLIVRGPSGVLCGYVGLAEGHPLHGKEYDTVPDVDVHGGLTFASACADSDDESRHVCHVPGPGEPGHVWWFGFDCAHSCDIRPASAVFERKQGWAPIGDYYARYRDLAYVERHCAGLARQLATLR